MEIIDAYLKDERFKRETTNIERHANMASISREGKGRRIQFNGADGKRKTVRLGPVSQRAAESVRLRVEALLSSAITESPWPSELAEWVRDLDAVLYDRLAAVGLLPRRQRKSEGAAPLTLGKFLDVYLSSKAGHKPNTRRNYEQTRKYLVKYFGAGMPLADITAGHADEWRDHLFAKRLSQATVSREVKRARQFLRAAVRKRLLTENPFEGLPSPQQVNKQREHFVTRDDTTKLLEACPNTTWRLIVALSRYGGLRCPSEHLALTWQDGDWERGRLRVRSPKTEHHQDGEFRWVPLFPELRDALWEAHCLAEEGATHVIAGQRDVNWRTQLERIIQRAGLKQWPRLFANLRASRATELAAEYPAHVAAAWLGHSTLVAQKHYWQVTDADFERATMPRTTDAESDARAAEKTTQNPTQPESATLRQDVPKHPKTNAGRELCHVSAGPSEYWQNVQVPPRGVEPLLPD